MISVEDWLGHVYWLLVAQLLEVLQLYHPFQIVDLFGLAFFGDGTPAQSAGTGVGFLPSFGLFGQLFCGF